MGGGRIVLNEKVNLYEIFKIKSGYHLARRMDYFEEGDNEEIIKVLSNKGFNIDGELKVNEEAVSEKIINDENLTHENDIVLTTTFPVKSRFITKEDEGILIPTGFLVLRVKDETKYDPEFIAYLLNYDGIQQQLRVYSGDATIPRLTKKSLDEVKFILPDIETQKEYATLIRMINMRIQMKEKSIENDKQLTTGLLEKALGA